MVLRYNAVVVEDELVTAKPRNLAPLTEAAGTISPKSSPSYGGLLQMRTPSNGSGAAAHVLSPKAPVGPRPSVLSSPKSGRTLLFENLAGGGLASRSVTDPEGLSFARATSSSSGAGAEVPPATSRSTVLTGEKGPSELGLRFQENFQEGFGLFARQISSRKGSKDSAGQAAAEGGSDNESAEDPEAAAEFERQQAKLFQATRSWSMSRYETRKSMAGAGLRFSAGGSPQRFYCDHLYRCAEQKELWKKMEGATEDEEEVEERIRTRKMSDAAGLRPSKIIKRGSRSFQSLKFDDSDEDDSGGTKKAKAAADDNDDDDDMSPEEEAAMAAKALAMKSAVSRRKSAFIIDVSENEPDLDLDPDVAPPSHSTSHRYSEPGTGGSGGAESPRAEGRLGDGDGPGASASYSETKSEAPPARSASEKAKGRGPHPLKDLLTAKKVNIKDVRALLVTMNDLAGWIAAPLDPGKPYLPKPLAFVVSETNVALVELLVEFGADVFEVYDGPAMYKGWVKPGCLLLDSVSNRKGRFIGTMLADKLEKIEGIFAAAAEKKAAQEKAAQEAAASGVFFSLARIGISAGLTRRRSAGELGTTNIEMNPKEKAVSDSRSDGSRHTQGHPKDVCEILQHLGDGDTSTVWAGWHSETQLAVAVKVEAKSDEAAIFGEINLMRSIKHPNIAQLYETFENEAQVFMVLELCEGAGLYDSVALGDVADGRPHNQSFSRSPLILRQLAVAVEFLHGRSICHRDIQIENFLLATPKGTEESQAMVKLIDFTTAKDFSNQELVTKFCTPMYVAREILARRMDPYTEKVDVWSLGVLFFIMLCGHPPFAGDTDFDILKKVKKAAWKFEPAEAWKDVSKDAQDLVQKMIVADEKERLSASQVLQHAYLLAR